MADVDEIVRRAAMALVRRSIEQLPRCSTRAVEEALWPVAVAQHAHGLLYALNSGEAPLVMGAVRAEAKKIVEWMDGQLGHYWMATEEPEFDADLPAVVSATAVVSVPGAVNPQAASVMRATPAPKECPQCGLNPIADGYTVCEVCAYRPRSDSALPVDGEERK